MTLYKMLVCYKINVIYLYILKMQNLKNCDQHATFVKIEESIYMYLFYFTFPRARVSILIDTTLISYYFWHSTKKILSIFSVHYMMKYT